MNIKDPVLLYIMDWEWGEVKFDFGTRLITFSSSTGSQEIATCSAQERAGKKKSSCTACGLSRSLLEEGG